MSVEYNGNKYRVSIIGDVISLDLSGLEIDDISKIKGLEALTDLKVLNLNHNRISEIKELESLVNLEELHLDHNQITTVDGLDQLSNLRRLSLYNNKIVQIKSFKNKDKLLAIHLGGNPIYTQIIITVGEVTPQSVLKYCQMSLEEKEQSQEKKKKIAIAKLWGLWVLLTLALGAGIIFFGLIWGTLLMIFGIIIMVVVLGKVPGYPGLGRGVKISLIVVALISTAFLIVLYIYFQIFWYFG